MKAVVFPVKDEGTEDSGTNFVQCSPEEAEYWGLYIEHEPGYQIHVWDFKNKKKAIAIRDSLSLALSDPSNVEL